MKNFLQLNHFKFWGTLVFVYLSSFFNTFFTLRVENIGDVPTIFFIDVPIDFITGIINQFFGFVIPSASQNIAFLAFNSFVSVLIFVLNILYYYVLASLVYCLFKNFFIKKQLDNIS